MSTTTVDGTDLYRRAINQIHSLRAEIKALKEEIERLRQHVRDLDHDLKSVFQEEDYLTPGERLGMR